LFPIWKIPHHLLTGRGGRAALAPSSLISWAAAAGQKEMLPPISSKRPPKEAKKTEKACGNPCPKAGLNCST
jgi:hypothetical protein